VVKCSEVLQFSDGHSNIIRTLSKAYRQWFLTIIYAYILFFMKVYMVVFLFYAVIYVSSLLCLCILIVCLFIFIVPAGTLRLTCLRYFRAFSSVVSNCQGKTLKDGTRNALFQIAMLLYILFVLCRSVYCLCINVYCITVTGWLPNCF